MKSCFSLRTLLAVTVLAFTFAGAVSKSSAAAAHKISSVGDDFPPGIIFPPKGGR